MLQSSRNRPDYFAMADFERFEELLAQSDAQMKQRMVEFFPRALQQPKYHKLVSFCYATYLVTVREIFKSSSEFSAVMLLHPLLYWTQC